VQLVRKEILVQLVALALPVLLVLGVQLDLKAQPAPLVM
jgi:hypothetical protein